MSTPVFGKVRIKRLATGVPGLDDVLGGGLPEYGFNLIAGAPGSGKTTLAHQLMFAMACAQRTALYVTVLGEPAWKMLRYQQQFGFFDAGAIGRTVHFVDLSEEAASGDLARLLAGIVEAAKVHQAALVFVDSFGSVVRAGSAAGQGQRAVQQFVQQLGMLMTSWQATTFLIGEHPADRQANPVLTIADGLIWMHQSVERNSVVRKMEVMKMRGQPTLPGLHTFRIGGQGVEVFAPAGVAVRGTDAPSAPPFGERVSLGVPLLDRMLGGGLPAGYSLLVAGPSGSGKSVLAASFLAHAVKCGESAVMAAFEQHPSRSRDPRVRELISTGRVALVDGRAADLSVDEIVAQIMREVHRLGASRVVIDSLTGFELTLAPTFRSDFRESLLRMVNALSAHGVTTLLTCELEDRYKDLRFSPYGAAFLTDAILVQRYIEVESRLLRVLAVVKVRASAHANELRLYTIDDTGLCIGQMLPEHEGLLGGRPTHKREAAGPAQAAVSPAAT